MIYYFYRQLLFGKIICNDKYEIFGMIRNKQIFNCNFNNKG